MKGMIPRREGYFPSPGDPNGLITAKVKLDQREVMFSILAVAVAQCPMPVDVDAALLTLNAAEGFAPEANTLHAEEVKRVILSLQGQLSAQHQEAQAATTH